MRITIYAAEKSREDRVVASLANGFRRHGEHVDIVLTHHSTEPVPGNHLCVFVGVRRKSRRVYLAAKAAGQQTLMLDKGYFERGAYHRFSLNAPQPVYVKDMKYDNARLKTFNWKPARRMVDAGDIVYVESTQKYYDFHGLGPVHDYSEGVCNDIKSMILEHHDPMFRLVHRPRVSPSSKLAPVEVADAVQVKGSFAELLLRAYCVVTHGSNAGVEAFAAGVPVISLGSAETFPVHDLVNAGLDRLFNLSITTGKAVQHRLAQLAWCQFNHHEVTSGFAWEHVKPWMQ
jgi:hypothetical protein